MKVKKKSSPNIKKARIGAVPIRTTNGQFAKGTPPPSPAGRGKGTPNKFTTLKAAFLEAFNHIGGVERLESWAEEDPRNTKVFYTLLARMLPREVVVAGTDDVTPNNLRGLKDEELDAILLGHLKES